MLSDDERAVLALNIQKRHIIGHNLGVVDEKFATHAEDAKIGETVHLVGEDIRHFANVSQKVVDRLDGWLGGSPSPTIGEVSPIVVAPREIRTTMDDRLAELNLELSLLARKLGLWVAQRCPNGMREHIDEDDVLKAFEGVADRDLAEAIAELEADGFGSVTRFSGQRLPLFRPSNDLYVTFDPIASGTDPMADAVVLAGRALEEDDGVNVRALHTASEWSLRRFNPALAVVVSQIDDRRVSKTMSGEYQTTWFGLLPEDRIALKRFIQRMGA